MPAKKRSLMAIPSCPDDLLPIQVELQALLTSAYKKNKEEGRSFRQMCYEYQLAHSDPGAAKDNAAKVLTAVGVAEPGELIAWNPENMERTQATCVLQWSYAPESMWRGPATPWDHNVLKLAKAMVASGFRQDCQGSS